MGQGPMTGGGFGFCTPNQVGGFRRTAPGAFGGGRGFFCRGGMGMGRGFRNMYYATGQTAWQRTNAAYSKEAEIETLEQDMQNIQQRLEELKNENSNNS
jgi:hypothetical protein